MISMAYHKTSTPAVNVTLQKQPAWTAESAKNALFASLKAACCFSSYSHVISQVLISAFVIVGKVLGTSFMVSFFVFLLSFRGTLMDNSQELW